jgi:hypothetical protein
VKAGISLLNISFRMREVLGSKILQKRREKGSFVPKMKRVEGEHIQPDEKK